MGYKRIKKFQDGNEYWKKGANVQHGNNMNHLDTVQSINDGTKDLSWEDYVDQMKNANTEAILNKDKALLESQWNTGDYGGFSYVNMPEEFYVTDDQGNKSFNMDLLYQDFIGGGKNPMEYMHTGNPKKKIGPNFKTGGNVVKGKFLRSGGIVKRKKGGNVNGPVGRNGIL